VSHESGDEFYESLEHKRRNILPLLAGYDSEVTDVRFLRKIDPFVSM
jgi:hypothetical protein